MRLGLDLVFGLQGIWYRFSLPCWLSLGLESKFVGLGAVLVIPNRLAFLAASASTSR